MGLSLSIAPIPTQREVRYQVGRNDKSVAVSMEIKTLDLGFEKPPEKKKILVVDDEPFIQGLVMDALGDQYRISLAGNGKEGVKMASLGKPNLILMDLLMP